MVLRRFTTRGWQRGGANSDGRADIDKSTRCTLTPFTTHNYAFIYRACVYLTAIFHFSRAPHRHTGIALVKWIFYKIVKYVNH